MQGTEDIKRAIDMIMSPDPEMKVLGLQIVEKLDPQLWACYLNFTFGTKRAGDGVRTHSSVSAIGSIPHGFGKEEIMSLVERNKGWSVGDVVYFKGMENCPKMVITNISIMKVDSNSAIQYDVYQTFLSVKYFKKSSQDFFSLTERIECFEKVKINIDES